MTDGAARGQRPRVGVRSAGTAIAGAALVAATVAVGADLGVSDTVVAARVEDVPLTLSVLQDSVPVDQVDSIPVALLPGSALDGVLAHDELDGSFSVWLFTAPEGELCVVRWSENDGTGAGGACLPLSQMLTEGVVSIGGWPDHTYKTVVVLPDGYTTARAAGETFDVENNVAVISTDVVPRGELEVDGPGVPAVRWPTTDFWGISATS